jgi:hypothetical protein
LFGDLVEGGLVTVGLDNDELTFVVTEIPKPLTKEEKKAARAAKKAAEDAKVENESTES